MEQEAAGEVNDTPIEQVRLSVPVTDDTMLPTLTFRTWVLGLFTCIIRAFSNQFFAFRQNNIGIPSVCFQMILLPVGHLMASTLPSNPLRIPGTKWEFSMNPGPFNMKEHILISLIGDSGDESPFSVEIITMMKVFYHRKIHALVIMLMSYTSEMIGYGYAGLFMKFLIEDPYMWYPELLSGVTFYRLLHDVEAKCKGQLTRMQFFQIVFVISFAYFIVPNYFFPSITALSIVCWIWKDSVTAQQLGSGFKGLGLGSISLDWNMILRAGDPFSLPIFSIINTMVGFALFMYIITPIVYWRNAYNAKRFPILSTGLFDNSGHIYNISRVIDTKSFSFDALEFRNYSQIHLSTTRAISYGLSFASVFATLTHVALFYGRKIWHQLKDASHETGSDVHARLMKKYEPIPKWWFFMILVTMVPLAFVACMMNKRELQIPIWGLLLALISGFILVLPISIIGATTGQFVSTNIIHELVIGYLYPGRPLATMTYRAYSNTCLSQARNFLSSFKFGHYMKIPPRSMFITQIVGTAISTLVRVTTAWWILSNVNNICHPELLPKGSPWTCPTEDVSYNNSIVWGLVGPSNVFAPHGLYGSMYLFILLGLFGPILMWFLLHYFPEKKWIKLINLPIILSPPIFILAYGPVVYVTFFIVGIGYYIFVYRKFKGWWARYNYVLSMALSTGPACVGLLLSVTLQAEGIYGMNWWGLEIGDHCPLANCPTAPGIKVDNCPVFH